MKDMVKFKLHGGPYDEHKVYLSCPGTLTINAGGWNGRYVRFPDWHDLGGIKNNKGHLEWEGTYRVGS